MATVETVALATLKLLDLIIEQKKQSEADKKAADKVVKELPPPPKPKEA